MHPINIFSHRVHQLIDIIETMKQFYKLIELTKSLPQLTEKQMTSKPEEVSDGEENDSFEDIFTDYSSGIIIIIAL